MIESGGWFVNELDGGGEGFGDDSRSMLPPIIKGREGEEADMDIVETPIKQDLEAGTDGSQRSFFAF
jgi:hypothetical protein